MESVAASARSRYRCGVGISDAVTVETVLGVRTSAEDRDPCHGSVVLDEENDDEVQRVEYLGPEGDWRWAGWDASSRGHRRVASSPSVTRPARRTSGSAADRVHCAARPVHRPLKAPQAAVRVSDLRAGILRCDLLTHLTARPPLPRVGCPRQLDELAVRCTLCLGVQQVDPRQPQGRQSRRRVTSAHPKAI